MLRLPKIVLGLVVLFAAIQLLPLRVKNHPTVSEPNWDSPRTEQLFRAACANCHSNHTHLQFYDQVAPVAWWVANHVSEGRDELNVSECNQTHHMDKAAREVRGGDMPPKYYTWFGLHGEAKLSAQERDQLATGLEATAALGCKND